MALFTMRGIRENEENMKINVKFDFYEQRPYIHSTQLLYELLKIMKDNNYYKEEKDLIKISCTYKVMADKQGYYIIDEVYSGSYNAWQYSSSETIPGINGNVDVSVWF